MTDNLTPEQRHLNMSRIKGRDTKPEMVIRRGLHSRGLRYSLHRRNLPGRPDLTFHRFSTVVFVHGCFWHLHRCPRSKIPESEFWARKLSGNAARDCSAVAELLQRGWNVLIIWDCAIVGPGRRALQNVLDEAELFIRSERENRNTGLFREISGNFEP